MRLAHEQHRQGRPKGSYTPNPAEQEVYPVVDPPRVNPQPPGRFAMIARALVPTTGKGLVGGNSSGFSSVEVAPPAYSKPPSDPPVVPPASFDRDVRKQGPPPTGRSTWAPSLSREAQAPSPYRASTDAALKQKSKLPHGLTVQELKEMTKARLQAEATDTVDDGRPLRTPEPHAAPALETRTAPPPTPPFREGWNPDSRPSDGWDNASVGTSNSDAFPDFPEDYAFNRPRSYTSDSPGVGDGMIQSQASYTPGNSPYYDAMGYAQNRRRAATLSPRLGLGHVQEDRPVDIPIPMPSFSGSSGLSHPPGLQARPVSAFNSGSLGFARHGNCASNQNRPRTSSAVSLPARSDTADEFGLEPLCLSSPFGAVREESATPGLSDVFRDHRFSPVPSMMDNLGIYTDNRSRAATWSDGLMSSAELSDDLASLLKLAGPGE
jgi:hypothetical protein